MPTFVQTKRTIPLSKFFIENYHQIILINTQINDDQECEQHPLGFVVYILQKYSEALKRWQIKQVAKD